MIGVRSTTVGGSSPGIVLNEHYEGDGAIIFKHAQHGLVAVTWASCRSLSCSEVKLRFGRDIGRGSNLKFG